MRSILLLSSGSNIALTIGGTLRLDGSGNDGTPQIKTDTRDGTISLLFPNAHSGSFFIDGVESSTKHGQDGFFTGQKPAKIGDTLLLKYGL